MPPKPSDAQAICTHQRFKLRQLAEAVRQAVVVQQVELTEAVQTGQRGVVFTGPIRA